MKAVTIALLLLGLALGQPLRAQIGSGEDVQGTEQTPNTVQEPSANKEPSANSEPSANRAPPPEPKPTPPTTDQSKTKPNQTVFRPSEEISEDLPVPFPVDI